jgi:hypothetical protein
VTATTLAAILSQATIMLNRNDRAAVPLRLQRDITALPAPMLYAQVRPDQTEAPQQRVIRI